MPSKLEKFSALDTFPNTFKFFFEEISNGFILKGRWEKDFFKNKNPIVLELGCGKGEYTIGLAQNNLNKNYIGVDVKGNRIWSGASHALDNNLSNVGFIRTRIDFIDHCFSENEVDEIWVTFPDPQPQKTRERKRLTHPMFLNRYKKFLKPGGLIHLKTDSTSLYEYTLETLKEIHGSTGLTAGPRIIWHTSDLYKNCPADRQELINIKTYYEALFTSKGEDIKYICFSL